MSNKVSTWKSSNDVEERFFSSGVILWLLEEHVFQLASNFFLLSWASVWNSDSLVVGAAQGLMTEGLCDGIRETVSVVPQSIHVRCQLTPLYQAL